MDRHGKYRGRLPQLDGRPFLTDGGLETTLVFHEGWDLPNFEAFIFLDSDRGRDSASRLFRPLCADGGCRRSRLRAGEPDLARQPGLGREDRIRPARARPHQPRGNRPDGRDPRALRDACAPMVISGCIGPRGDGYDPGTLMAPDRSRNLPRLSDRHFPRSRRRFRLRLHHDQQQRGSRASPRPPRPPTCLASSPSRWKPMGACRPARASRTRSRRSMRRRQGGRPIT